MTTDVTEVVGAVHEDLAALLARLRAGGDVADEAMAGFLGGFLDRLAARGSTGAVDVMIRLPLLVHAAESGDPGGGRPAAVVHVLWWAAARYLDDLADGGPFDPARCNADILAALGVGSHLPARLLREARVPDATKVAAQAELSRGWLDGISGQLLDLAARPATATTASVLASYEGKTGAPYAMATAAAACLAGADPGRVDRWRDVGRRFGVLRQLTNDQRDLVTGRDEDLRNGAATFLVMLLLDGVPAAQRPGLLALHAAAATSADARAEFKALLTGPEHLRAYHGRVDAMVAEVHGALHALGGTPPYTSALHTLVDDAMLAFPLPVPVA
ncbi:class 1 isoprenoid biosynthesis enzyme [Dactylosporangium sp. NPDC050588]|uniref:class 1 isoprenoid biosynthesis enzyme n=1 Tax=Dactylosporangium sp. NPDC050588 TaxID=3157211 RepID=UPI0033CFCB1A